MFGPRSSLRARIMTLISSAQPADLLRRATSAPGVRTGGDRSVDSPVLPVPGKRLHRVHVCLVFGLAIRSPHLTDQHPTPYAPRRPRVRARRRSRRVRRRSIGSLVHAWVVPIHPPLRRVSSPCGLLHLCLFQLWIAPFSPPTLGLLPKSKRPKCTPAANHHRAPVSYGRPARRRASRRSAAGLQVCFPRPDCMLRFLGCTPIQAQNLSPLQG
ncbi:hypothetical protein B0H14DRAFT_739952 [Mycena olivaceomarginata]|nr:hypothetical protein B0H14DRAFT_739952 [Mycena olivaceomarginata]